MFQGSIPPDMQKIVAEIVRTWNVPDLYVGCSGNLTVERGLAADGIRLHSCDVNLYSIAIGSYFAGKLIPYTLSETGAEEFGWMAETMETDTDRLATLMLASALCALPGQHTAYFQRMLRQYRTQWARMHQKTREKLLKLSESFQLASFDPEDVFTWVDRIPAEAGFVSFPPFSPKGYVDMFAKLEETFSWQRPEYQLVTQERKYAYLERAMQRDHWMFCLDYEEPQFAEFLRGETLTTSRAVKIRTYASDGPKRIVRPSQAVRSPLITHLVKGQKITADSKIAIAKLTLDQFNALRSRYLSHGIAPGAASFAYGITVDGNLIGVTAYSNASSPIDMSTHVETPNIYMISDFAVGGTSYPRLSRLVVAAALSHEMKFLIERDGNRRYRSVTTTVFSKRPSSMKYRGLFRRLTGKLDKDGAHVLTYGQELGKWTLQEAFETWLKKTGEMDEAA